MRISPNFQKNFVQFQRNFHVGNFKENSTQFLEEFPNT